MEEKLNNNENGKRFIKLIVTVVIILIVATLATICYDKFVNKEKPPVPTPTPVGNQIIKSGEIILASSNQTVEINNNKFNVKFEKANEEDEFGNLYINDSLIRDVNGDNISVTKGYVADNFMIFIGYGQSFNVKSEIYQEWVVYAIDEEGRNINVNNLLYQLRNIRYENNEILSTGVNRFDALEEKATPVELVIKYEDNAITETPKQ